MQATRLTLICHAVTPLQKQGRFPDDESVAMDWQNAALSLADRYPKQPRLLCAPEARARQTAALYAGEAEIEEALRDGDFGHWKGVDIGRLDSDELHTWLTDSASAPHGGESVDQMCARVAQWMKTLETQPGHIVAITHPFVIRAALLYVMQFPLSMFYRIDVEPLSATELRFNRVWRLRLETHA
ncbi:histidine phosphatase family protein [Pseudomonas extremaustralis]|jgi:broad specificity phosphatase PhoE|uniref:Broad specificity phosphatase PhoE n=1 Tax=Pseudomonas extremaustralis TaxID=359110 RepID=A0A5C5QJW2_9PSED|nr:histidine phosphatase family protein [Pseudomonas extremaustralis]EZI28681.1 phosphoglycerate mutase [Pseudomonas extremaustralis 14-3 substr. 14-3b]MDF3136366.1 histidine phosphatase family protein [Pseudomonas extremaustralis]TWS05730.1 histidine phosphatase family protein [Pseudomonas extremaustralis]SDF14323.1 Broad specificity phosphatase PhoE [Pseudomonas extremaustralis]